MMDLAPPRLPPRIAFDDGNGFRHLRVRLFQWWFSIVTILATAWVCTLGPIPGIIAVVTAKHLLVAVLVMGMGVDAPQHMRRGS